MQQHVKKTNKTIQVTFKKIPVMALCHCVPGQMTWLKSVVEKLPTGCMFIMADHAK